ILQVVDQVLLENWLTNNVLFSVSWFKFSILTLLTVLISFMILRLAKVKNLKPENIQQKQRRTFVISNALITFLTLILFFGFYYILGWENNLVQYFLMV